LIAKPPDLLDWMATGPFAGVASICLLARSPSSFKTCAKEAPNETLRDFLTELWRVGFLPTW
jgi:hypothetical protein